MPNMLTHQYTNRERSWVVPKNTPTHVLVVIRRVYGCMIAVLMVGDVGCTPIYLPMYVLCYHYHMVGLALLGWYPGGSQNRGVFPEKGPR